MKKRISLLILILALFLVISCDTRRVLDFNEGVIITDIETANDGCFYYSTNTNSAGLIYKGVFYDECGKYTVGDTVRTVKWSK